MYNTYDVQPLRCATLAMYNTIYSTYDGVNPYDVQHDVQPLRCTTLTMVYNPYDVQHLRFRSLKETSCLSRISG